MTLETGVEDEAWMERRKGRVQVSQYDIDQRPPASSQSC